MCVYVCMYVPGMYICMYVCTRYVFMVITYTKGKDKLGKVWSILLVVS